MPVDRGSSSSIRRIAVAGLQLEVWRAQASEKPHVEVRSSLYHHAKRAALPYASVSRGFLRSRRLMILTYIIAPLPSADRRSDAGQDSNQSPDKQFPDSIVNAGRNRIVMIFGSWTDLVRILSVGATSYLALVVLLRISGKRTLTKLNAFDLVITVALGSTLATVLLNKSVTLSEGVLAMALLIFLQLAITWLSVRSEKVQRLVKAEPTLIIRDGSFLENALRRERVTHEEVLAALRSHGVTGVAAAILETDGSVSVLSEGVAGKAANNTLQGVAIHHSTSESAAAP